MSFDGWIIAFELDFFYKRIYKLILSCLLMKFAYFGRGREDRFIFPEHEMQLKNTIDKNCERLKMSKSIRPTSLLKIFRILRIL